MRIVIDLEAAQGEMTFSTDGTAALRFAQAMAAERGDAEIILVLSDLYGYNLDRFRAAFRDALPEQAIRVHRVPGPVAARDPANDWRRRAGIILRNAFINSRAPDFILVTNLLGGWERDSVTAIDTVARARRTVAFLPNFDTLRRALCEHADPRRKAFFADRLRDLAACRMIFCADEAAAREISLLLGCTSHRVVPMGLDATEHCREHDWRRAAHRVLDTLSTIAAPDRNRFRTVPPNSCEKPALAFLSPLPPARSGIADYSAALLDALSAHYRITVVTDQEDLDRNAIPSECAVHSIRWFEDNAHRFDRILYHFGNSAYHRHMFPLIARFPGVVVLHDFFLGHVAAFPEQRGLNIANWSAELLKGHGYGAVRDCLTDADAFAAAGNYPCNSTVIENALGIITHSRRDLELAVHWYGEGASRNWQWIEEHLDPPQLAEAYRDAIEMGYAAGPEKRRMEAIGAIATLPGPPGQRDLLACAEAIAFDHPSNLPGAIPRRTLFVDVSAIVEDDIRTGIERAARAIIKQLLEHPPPGWVVEPVRATVSKNYRHARRFALQIMGAPPVPLPEEPVTVRAGDIFLCLDFTGAILVRHTAFLDRFRQLGGSVYAVLYDLLPIRHPEYFGPGIPADFDRWLDAVTTIADGVIAISRTVADDASDWALGIRRFRHTPLKLGWFHLGSDIQSSHPTVGVPAALERRLGTLASRPTVLMVGTVEPRKGHDEAITAFERLWAEGYDCNLVIVGKQGRQVDELARRLRRHRMRGRRLFWHDRLSDEALLRLYDICAGVLVASQAEGFGLPLIEAAAHGKPILARDIPVFREVAGAHAEYFGDSRPGPFARAISAWLGAIAAGAAPTSNTMPHLSWAQSTAQLMELILQPEHPRWVHRLHCHGGVRPGETITPDSNLVFWRGWQFPEHGYRRNASSQASVWLTLDAGDWEGRVTMDARVLGARRIRVTLNGTLLTEEILELDREEWTIRIEDVALIPGEDYCLTFHLLSDARRASGRSIEKPVLRLFSLSVC